MQIILFDFYQTSLYNIYITLAIILAAHFFLPTNFTRIMATHTRQIILPSLYLHFYQSALFALRYPG